MEQENKVITEDDLIQYIFFFLYKNLSKNEMHLEQDILAPTHIILDDNQLEHLRELLFSTSFIKPCIGFGKRGLIYLTGQGIHMMKTYGSYMNYVQALPVNKPMHSTHSGDTLKKIYNTTTPQNNALPSINEEDEAH